MAIAIKSNWLRSDMRHLTQFLPLSAVLASLLGGSLCAIAQEIEPLSPELSTVAETESEPASSETAQIPFPGTSITNAASLSEQPAFTPVPELAQLSEVRIAQGVEPRQLSGGVSYVGIGANIGVGGDSAIGRFGFAAVSKIGFTQNLSVRPSLIVNNRVSLLVPITYDLIVGREPFDPVAFAPFVGGGVAFDFSGRVGPMLTGGVDFPLTPQLTATGSANVAFLGDSTKFGILVGVGYNFGGLFER